MKASLLLGIARARVFGKAAPLAVGFELTHRCNLACEYCDRHTPLPNEMSRDEIFAALDGLHRIGMREISLDGGEPLTHRYVGDVVAFLRERDVVVRMNTNGILVRRKSAVVKRLAKVKISLDGPAAVHDGVRGPRAFDRAVDGVKATQELGVPAELTCVVGRHNAHAIDEVVEIAKSLGVAVIFQPARDNLFGGPSHPGAAFRLDETAVLAAFARVERLKQDGGPVLNGWASLRHFRSFPRDTPLPCAAGFINATLDPEGVLFHCGQVDRSDRDNSVVHLGAEEAFRRLSRVGCGQCWCARVVEENAAWGGQFAKMLPPTSRSSASRVPASDATVVPASALLRRGVQSER